MTFVDFSCLGYHCLKLGGVTHGDDLPSVLRHFLENEGHLLVTETTPTQILLGQT